MGKLLSARRELPRPAQPQLGDLRILQPSRPTRGPDSPDIWKSIFWLQQRPSDPSADIAFARGRQGYLTEIPSQLPRARALYREITCTEGASNFILGAGAAERVAHAEIVREVRKGKAPSDHAPVLVDISTNWS